MTIITNDQRQIWKEHIFNNHLSLIFKKNLFNISKIQFSLTMWGFCYFTTHQTSGSYWFSYFIKPFWRMHLYSVPWLSTPEQSYTSLLSICKGSLSVWGCCESPIHYRRLKDVLWQCWTFRWQCKLLQPTSVVNFTVRLNSWEGCTLFTQAPAIWPLNHPQPNMSVPRYQL